MVAGEITTQAKLDYDTIVRKAVAGIGYDSFVDDLSSVDSKGLSCKTCEVIVRINKQSPDIAGGVHVGKDDMDCGAGDQGIMFGYASDETSNAMPLTHSMATRLGKVLTGVRKNGKLWWLRPDGKTQVTIEYLQKALWRPHAHAHQPIRQVHHRWPTGGCRPYRTQDHHRHLWWLGCSRWRCLFWQGPNQGGPLCSLHLQADGQVHCEERPVQESPRAAFICHRCGQAPLPLCGNLRHRARFVDTR